MAGSAVIRVRIIQDCVLDFSDDSEDLFDVWQAVIVFSLQCLFISHMLVGRLLLPMLP